MTFQAVSDPPALCIVSFVFGFWNKPVQKERKVAAEDDVWRQPRDGFGPDSFSQVLGQGLDGNFALSKRALIERRKDLS